MEQSWAKGERTHKVERWLGGVGFAALLAVVGYGLAWVPGLHAVGPMACAILTAVVVRQVYGYPERWRAGIQFVSKHLLRVAIILYGLKLNLAVVVSQGPGLLVRDLVVVVFSIVVMGGLARLFKADASLSLLLGIGTGVCGAAAIAAVTPIVQAKEEDTAIGVGMVALVGTLFAVGYTVLGPLLPLDAVEYGAWAGVSLHEIAHVALAGAPAGQEALTMALLAKLGRVLLLVPLCMVLMVWMKRSGKLAVGTKVAFPWFLLGFLLMSAAGPYVPAEVTADLSQVTAFLLTMAMVGLGLNVNLKELRSKALRPLAALLMTSILLSVLTYLMV